MNRGRLFSQIEHIERAHSHGLERPTRALPSPAERPPSPPAPAPRLTPKARAEPLFRPRTGSEHTLTASPSAIATAMKRAKSTRPPPVVTPPVHNPEGAVKLAAKALKVMLSLDPEVLGKIELPEGKPAHLCHRRRRSQGEGAALGQGAAQSARDDRTAPTRSR